MQVWGVALRAAAAAAGGGGGGGSTAMQLPTQQFGIAQPPCQSPWMSSKPPWLHTGHEPLSAIAYGGPSACLAS